MERTFFALDTGASGGKCFAGFFGDDGSFRMEEVWRFDHESARFFASDRNGEVTQRLCWDDTWIYQQAVKGLQHYRRNFGEKLDGEISRCLADVYRHGGEEFNLNSPRQLGVILFDKLGLPAKRKPKPATPPTPRCWSPCAATTPSSPGF